LWKRGRSGIDGVVIVKKAVMDGLIEKTYEQRLEGGEGVSSNVIIWRKSPKRREKEHVQKLRTWAERKDVNASGQKDRGMFKRGTLR